MEPQNLEPIEMMTEIKTEIKTMGTEMKAMANEMKTMAKTMATEIKMLRRMLEKFMERTMMKEAPNTVREPEINQDAFVTPQKRSHSLKFSELDWSGNMNDS
jgi:hypothetical protein